MSHITHFYHLAALDYLDTTAFPGMSPWIPSLTASVILPTGTGTIGHTLVEHYVDALGKRMKCHSAGALFSGRQPCQTAIVPGGVTTLFSNNSTVIKDPLVGTDWDQYGPFTALTTTTKFLELMNDVRNFINTTYIPDVIYVATTVTPYWTVGTGCGNLLAYGEFPDINGTLLIKRGIEYGAPASLTLTDFDQANIGEYAKYSHYKYPTLDPDKALKPKAGVTVPRLKTVVPEGFSATSYSWIKAPRYSITDWPAVMEVGPLARMVVSYLYGYTYGATAAPLVSQSGGLGPYVAPLAAFTVPAEYSITDLVGNACLALDSLGVPGVDNLAAPAGLFSVLGRHAARALEAKFIADAMCGTSGPVTSWLDQLVPDATAYTYKKMTKANKKGFGLCEAPRGALGHWISIDSRKIMNYQAVVPTTWNASPKDGNDVNGAIEQALLKSNIGTTDPDRVVNILRIIHPFDICIACAVHIVTPEGKEIARFAIDPDGKVKSCSSVKPA